MRVSQLLGDKQRLKMTCPRCGKEEIVPLSEIEGEENEVFDNNTELQ